MIHVRQGIYLCSWNETRYKSVTSYYLKGSSLRPGGASPNNENDFEETIDMLDQEKVFDMMYDLLNLHDEMNLSTFTSMSMCFLCATLQALDHTPPMVRQQVYGTVMEFVDSVTRDGEDHHEAMKILDKLGLSERATAEAHTGYAEATRN